MSSDCPILYSFRRCPYAIRARMALAYAGVRCEIREIDLRNKPPEMLSISPKGTVPVMQCVDGMVLEESLDIMQWALSQSDPDDWANRVDMALICETDTDFKVNLNHYKYPEWYPDEDVDPLAARNACMAYLERLNTRLSKHYIHGEHIGFTDVALFSLVRQCVNVDIDWFKSLAFCGVQRWYNSISDRDLYKKAMEEFSLWYAGSEPSYFN